MGWVAGRGRAGDGRRRTVTVGGDILSPHDEPTGGVRATLNARGRADALRSGIAQGGLGAEPGGSHGVGGDGRHLICVEACARACACVETGGLKSPRLPRDTASRRRVRVRVVCGTRTALAGFQKENPAARAS